MAGLFRLKLFDKTGLLTSDSMIPRRRGFRAALRAGGMRRVVRCRKPLPGTRVRHFGALASGKRCGISRAIRSSWWRNIIGKMLLLYAWPIIVAKGLWGMVAITHGRGWSWLRGKWRASGGGGNCARALPSGRRKYCGRYCGKFCARASARSAACSGNAGGILIGHYIFS